MDKSLPEPPVTPSCKLGKINLPTGQQYKHSPIEIDYDLDDCMVGRTNDIKCVDPTYYNYSIFSTEYERRCPLRLSKFLRLIKMPDIESDIIFCPILRLAGRVADVYMYLNSFGRGRNEINELISNSYRYNNIDALFTEKQTIYRYVIDPEDNRVTMQYTTDTFANNFQKELTSIKSEGAIPIMMS